MVLSEPGGLPEVGALPGHLEVQPLVLEVVELGGGPVGERVLGVVRGDEVLDDGAGFPEGDGGVGVDEGGRAAVRVERGEGRIFDVGESNDLGGVGEVELLENDEEFQGVWAARGDVGDERLDVGASGRRHV